MTRRERIALPAMVGFFGLGYALYGIFRHWRFGTNYDLAIFDQAVWHLSRFEAPASTVSGFSNVLGDHFYPIIALFAPLYWIAPRPETLIAAQAVLLASSIVPVFLFVRARIATGPALALAGAYASFWGLQRAAASDVHEVAFAPLVIATTILAMDRQRWPLFWMAAGVLALIKEDLIPLLTGFGVYLFVFGRSARTHAMLLILVSLIGFVAVTSFVIPFFNDHSGYSYAGAYGHVLAEPWRVPVLLVTPARKLETILLWFAPFVFAPLLSPLSLLVAPVAASRLLSASPTHWGPVFHYSAPLAPILAMSAADGLSRLLHYLRHKRGDRAARRVVASVAGLSLLLCLFLPGRQPLWRVFSPGHYRATPTAATGHAIVAMVPDGASVVAQAAIAPHLSRRDAIYVLDNDAPDAEYVVAANTLSPWPAANADEIQALLAERRARGYVTVVEQDGWTLLRRPMR